MTFENARRTQPRCFSCVNAAGVVMVPSCSSPENIRSHLALNSRSMKQNKGYVARARGDAVAQQNCHSASNGGAFLTNGTGVMVATKCSSSRDKAGYIVPGNTGVSGQDSGVELLKVLRVGVFPEGCCILWPGRAQGQAPLCCLSLIHISEPTRPY